MIDLAALLFSTAVGLSFGTVQTKILAAVSASYFIAQRFTMSFADVSYREVIIACIASEMMICCLVASRSITGRAYAALFFPQIIAFAAFQHGAIELGTMANVQTVFVYLQLLIIIGRGISDGYKSGVFNSVGFAHRRDGAASEKIRSGD
jgi:hypothetical protein